MLKSVLGIVLVLHQAPLEHAVQRRPGGGVSALSRARSSVIPVLTSAEAAAAMAPR